MELSEVADINTYDRDLVADDNIDSIKHRFVEYKEKTAPVLDYYKKQGNLVGINGVGEISDIFNNLCKEIDKIG